MTAKALLAQMLHGVMYFKSWILARMLYFRWNFSGCLPIVHDSELFFLLTHVVL